MKPATVHLIAPQFYLSNEYAAATVEQLITGNIRALVNIGYPQSCAHFDTDGDFSYMSLPVMDIDDGSENILQFFSSTFTFIGLNLSFLC